MAVMIFKGERISREAILRALSSFDEGYSDSNQYNDWLDKGNYKYAPTYGGKRYPCKYILSQASGLAIRIFSGGGRDKPCVSLAGV